MFLSGSFVMEWNTLSLLIDVSEDMHVRAFPSAALAQLKSNFSYWRENVLTSKGHRVVSLGTKRCAPENAFNHCKAPPARSATVRFQALMLLVQSDMGQLKKTHNVMSSAPQFPLMIPRPRSRLRFLQEAEKTERNRLHPLTSSIPATGSRVVV